MHLLGLILNALRTGGSFFLRGAVIGPIGILIGVVGFGTNVFVNIAKEKTFLAHKEIWAIFDNGIKKGPHPGQDLAQGISEARTITRPFLARLNISIEIQDDTGEERLAQQLAEKAARPDSGVIMVIGHLQSTIMARTLDTYLASDLPVIMPVPTNTSFTERNLQSTKKNLIRLPPNDAKQALVAAKFIIGHDRKKILVVRDADNAFYSYPLATLFTANIRASGTKQKAAPAIYNAAVGGDNSSESLVDSIIRNKIDAVFFAGTTENAITFLDSLNSIPPKKTERGPDQPLLILMSDGVLSADMLDKVHNIPPELYLTFQVPDKRSNNGDHGDYCGRNFKYSFCPYGVDSVLVTKKIIEDITSGFHGFKKTYFDNVSRADILGYFQELRKGNDVLPGAFGSYTFDLKGDNTGFDFTVLKADATHQWNPVPVANGGAP
jgi:hypothetical protein